MLRPGATCRGMRAMPTGVNATMSFARMPRRIECGAEDGPKCDQGRSFQAQIPRGKPFTKARSSSNCVYAVRDCPGGGKFFEGRPTRAEKHRLLLHICTRFTRWPGWMRSPG